MIDFSAFPKEPNPTFTVLTRSKKRYLRTAPELAGETGWSFRTSNTRDLRNLDDIRKQLPDWFDPLHCVFISDFNPEYLPGRIPDVVKDPDVLRVIEEEDRSLRESVKFCL